MDFKYHLETAWTLTLKFIAPLIIMTLVMFSVWVLSLGILVPVTTAGYMHSLLLVVRERREPSVKDIFSQMELFLPLLGFAFIAFISVLIASFLFVAPGILVSIFISWACIYAIPLMTDRRMGLFEAIKTSYRMGLEKPMVDHLAVVLIFYGISAIGSSVFIGALFTQPLATLFLMSVFEERMEPLEASAGEAPAPASEAISGNISRD